MKRKEVSIFNVKLLIIWRRHLKIARLGTDGKKTIRLGAQRLSIWSEYHSS